VIIQFDKHLSPITHVCMGGKENKTFVFTLSNKLHILRFHGFRVFGEVPFGNEVHFKCMLVYFNNSSTYDDVQNNLLSNIAGGFMLATSTEVRFFTFQNLNKPNVMAMPAEHAILDMYLVTPNHVAVAFESQPYLSIYNIHSHKLVTQVTLRGRVKKMQCNLRKGYIVSFNQIVKQDVNLIFLYAESNEIDIFKVEITDTTAELNEVDMLINKENDNLSLTKVQTLPSLGSTAAYKVNSLEFKKSERIVNTENILMVSLKNGNLARIQLNKQFRENQEMERKPACEVSYVRLRERYTKNAVQLLEAFENVCMFLDKKTDSLFVYVMRREGLFVVPIPGKFEDGFFMREHKVAGVVNGNLHVYLIIYDEEGSLKENSLISEENPTRPVSRAKSAGQAPQIARKHYYYVVRLMEFNYHYDKLTSHFVSGNCAYVTV
jgi:hypothetical protein